MGTKNPETTKIRATLKEGEHIILIARKHYITLIIPLIVIGLVFLIFFASPKEISNTIRPMALYFIVLSLLYLLYVFYDRKTDIFIITNYRVIKEWGIFSYNAMENSLDKIHNVGIRQDILGLMLNYGDIIIQTAAETSYKSERFIAAPKQFQTTIFKAQENLRITSSNAHSKQSYIEQNNNTDDTIECYYCAEKIKAKARICRYCNHEVESIESQQVKDNESAIITENQSTKNEYKPINRWNNRESPKAFIKKNNS